MGRRLLNASPISLFCRRLSRRCETIIWPQPLFSTVARLESARRRRFGLELIAAARRLKAALAALHTSGGRRRRCSLLISRALASSANVCCFVFRILERLHVGQIS